MNGLKWGQGRTLKVSGSKWKWMHNWGEPHPVESSWLWMKWAGLDKICLVGERGWWFSPVENVPSPSPKQLLFGISVCRGIQHARIAHQSMFKGYSYRKQILPIDNNWRNAEIFLRSGSVRHADARWLLRCTSWDEEFIPYALSLNIWFMATGLYKAKQASKDTMYSSGLISHGNLQC